ncbi:MAG: DUF1211 domain-containing protein [Actinomycetia bacterium]|nr:DUF1211 domain-containing protein [Actinomycetes bacterium]MCH9762419.1 DUF1211 domain-containing protein [Actinomycetes bacterium]
MSRTSRPLPTSRIEAFSDGVYAIVITLLVLDLGVPESSDRLLSDLSQEWPSFLGYLVSFVFIGSSWISHVKLTRSMSTCDDPFIGLNLLKLLFVSFLPFTTSLMADHLTDVGQRPAVVLFGLNLTLASAMNVVLAGYASRTESILREGERPELQRFLRSRWPYTVMFGLSTAAGAFLPTIAVILYLAVAAVQLFTAIVRRCGRTP